MRYVKVAVLVRRGAMVVKFLRGVTAVGEIEEN